MNIHVKLKKCQFVSVMAVTALLGCSDSSSDSDVDARPTEQDAGSKPDPDAARIDTLPSAPEVAVPPGLFLNGFFPIGAFSVPTEEFTKWKNRGVNTLVNDVGGEDEDRIQWDKEAVAAGFKVIRPPFKDPTVDIGNSALLAWSQEDEPDLNDMKEINLTILRKLRENYNNWKQIDPTRLVFLNFSGPHILRVNSPIGDLTEAVYKDMIATADWIANDIYPMSGFLDYSERRDDITLLSEPIDRLRSWAPTKPQFCFIESAKIYSEFRVVKPAELSAQMWLGIVHGVRGLFFFSHIFDDDDNWIDWDGTPNDVAAEMTKQNSIITSLAWVLQGEINPTSMSVVVPKGLEAGWRSSSLGKYVFIVNPSGTSYPNQTITLTGTSGSTSATVVGESRTVPVSGDGTTITDNFGAFAVHIYNLK